MSVFRNEWNREQFHENGVVLSESFDARNQSAPTPSEPWPQDHEGEKAYAGVSTDESPLTKEQEERLESWMEEVKAFIRDIDVNAL